MSPLSGRWVRAEGPELDGLRADLNGQLRYPLPEGTGIRRTRLSCYPSHALLHLEIPGPLGPRDSYAFHAPGQLHPLDWTRDTLRRFNEMALEVETLDQAMEAVRFLVWATLPPRERDAEGGFVYHWGERTWVVEGWDDLPLQDGVLVPDEERARVQALLGSPVQLPPREEDRAGVFRVGAAVAGAGGVRRVAFAVASGRADDLGMVSGGVVPLPLRSWPVGSERGVVLVREVSFDAQRFLRWISVGRPLHQARVTEPVVARGQVFRGPVHLSGVVFEDDVDFGGAVFEGGLVLHRCVLEGRMVLREATVKGSLDATGLTFRVGREGVPPPEEERWVRALDAEGLRVSGSVHLTGLRCPARAALNRAVVEGDLNLGGGEVGPPRGPTLEPEWNTALDLQATRLGGHLDLVSSSPYVQLPVDLDWRDVEPAVPGISTPATVVRGTLDARGMNVGGEVFLGGLRCEGRLDFENAVLGASLNGSSSAGRPGRLIVLGNFDLQRSQIAGTVLLGGMWVGRALDLANARVATAVFVRTALFRGTRLPPAVVRGDVVLSGVKAGDVEFEGSDLGNVVMATGSVGRLFLQAGVEEGEGGSVIRPCTAASVALSEVQVEKGIAFTGLRVRSWTGADGTRGGGFIQLQNVRCGGDLTVGRGPHPPLTDPPEVDRWLGGALPAPRAHRTVLEGDLRVDNFKGEGKVSLANTWVAGGVRIRNSRVEGSLDCGPLVSEAEDGGNGASLRCSHLDLEMTRCGGDADLSGIQVAGEGPDSSVLARQLVVEGRLLFSRPRAEWKDVDLIPSDPAERWDAVIEGRLDLSVAEASHLVLSGSSFQSQNARVGISLERGRFRRLHVIEPWPFRHDLSDVKVERWQIPTRHLLTFLDRSNPFRRSTYVEVERVLRNEAQEAEADRVYRGMRRRAIREEVAARKERGGIPRDPLGYLARTWGSRFLGFAYGWGTLYWLPMLFVALPTFLLSWGIFADQRNIEATPPGVLSRGLTLAGGPVRPESVGAPWGPSDGAWMALRFHVPVVPVGARSLWEPTRDAAVLRRPGGGDLTLPFSAEGYAFSILLLHWIVWPLFLYGLGRKIIRDRA